MTPAFPLRLHRCIRLLALAILAPLTHAGAAWAQASLNASQPADGAVVEAAPQSYSLTFSEPVSPLSLQLVQPDGSAVQLDRFAVKGNSVEIEAPTNLGRGTHVLTWRDVPAVWPPVGGSVASSSGVASVHST